MQMITYFHRNKEAGFSINKVTQTYVHGISPKQEYYVPFRRASMSDVLKNVVFVRNHRNKSGVNHVTGDIHYCILGLLRCKSVLTIHDTVALHFAKGSRIKKWIEKWLWFKLPIKLATKVVCISEETKKSILPFTNRNDIQVIYNAIDPIFKTKLKDQNRIPYNVLFIGANPNKNLERTVCALKGIDCILTIVGRLNQNQIEYLENSGIHYMWKLNLSDEEIVREYEECDIVSFISLFEGFGMPVIEANMVGRPVICSTIPVLKEVAGNSAIFVNPLDVNDMHDGFVRLFNDSALREQCVTKGLENVKRFNSSYITEQYVNLYDSLV